MQPYTLYRVESSDPTENARKNLAGRSHYADANTMLFFGSRILRAAVTDGGLILAIIESVRRRRDGSARVFQYRYFDVFGATLNIETPEFSTLRAAEKAMWRKLDTIDAKAITRKAIKVERKFFAMCMRELRRAAKL